ncbi:MAG TPA: LLM class F420-dependent oxidoreductase [Actinomycetota bacterium]|nr:LLM class F420-dependent oxidoreductase [Actinomycetota bacterium]
MGRPPFDPAPLALLGEELGYDCVWVSEAWGSDAVSMAAWIAARTSRIGVGTAVMQLAARTPAATAMTAATLDALSGGRFRLGLGTSGPRVVEGWHGARFDDPLGWTREYVEVIRRVLRREPLAFPGRRFRLPAVDGGGDGKPLRLAFPPHRPDLPIYLAALGPRNVALAAEVADGWLPMLFSPEHAEVFRGPLEEGFARRGGRPEGFDVAAFVFAATGEDLAACRDVVRPDVAFYVGAMGTRERNFYNRLVARYGYEAEAREIQEAYLDGRRREAVAAVPDRLVDEVALIGPVPALREGVEAYREAGVTSVVVSTTEEAVVRALAEAVG